MRAVAALSKTQRKNAKKRAKAVDRVDDADVRADFAKVAAAAAAAAGLARTSTRPPRTPWESHERSAHLEMLVDSYVPLVEEVLRNMGIDGVIDIDAKTYMIKEQATIITLMAQGIARGAHTGTTHDHREVSLVAQQSPAPKAGTPYTTGDHSSPKVVRSDAEPLVGQAHPGGYGPSEFKIGHRDSPAVQTAYTWLWLKAERQAEDMASQAPVPLTLDEKHSYTVSTFRQLKKKLKSRQKSKNGKARTEEKALDP